MGLQRKVKCVIVEGDNLLLKYNKDTQEWDLPGAPLTEQSEMTVAAQSVAEKQLGCDVSLDEFLGSHDYEHQGDMHRTFLFKASIRKMNKPDMLDVIRLIPIANLDKPTLNEDFAQALPLLKKKLLTK